MCVCGLRARVRRKGSGRSLRESIAVPKDTPCCVRVTPLSISGSNSAAEGGIPLQKAGFRCRRRVYEEANFCNKRHSRREKVLALHGKGRSSFRKRGGVQLRWTCAGSVLKSCSALDPLRQCEQRFTASPNEIRMSLFSTAVMYGENN